MALLLKSWKVMSMSQHVQNQDPGAVAPAWIAATINQCYVLYLCFYCDEMSDGQNRILCSHCYFWKQHLVAILGIAASGTSWERSVESRIVVFFLFFSVDLFLKIPSKDIFRHTKILMLRIIICSSTSQLIWNIKTPEFEKAFYKRTKKWVV